MDKFDQFFISEQLEYTNCFSGEFLRKAFRLKEQTDENECIFIRKLYDDIFYCGRNMALLRLCDPKVRIKNIKILIKKFLQNNFFLKKLNLKIYF